MKTQKVEKDTLLLPAVYDCIFKAAMLDSNLKDVLVELIHDITGIPVYLLKGMTVRNVEHLVENKKDKKMRSDIIVNVGKRYLNIEVNRVKYEGVFEKNDAYLSKLKASMYKEKESYLDAGEVIQINFDNFYYYKHKQDIYKFVAREETTGEIDDTSTVKYHVCLLNIWNRCYNMDIDKLSRFERYCLILRSKSKDYVNKIAGDDELMGKLVEKLETLSADEEIIGLYNVEVEEEKMRKTIEQAAERKGLKEGFEQGIEQGVEQTKKEIILSMYNKGYETKEIADIAQISEDNIEAILKSNNV